MPHANSTANKPLKSVHFLVSLQSPLAKRFSMNYQDLVDPANPKSWRNTMPDGSGGGGRSTAEKRFSMNFQDVIRFDKKIGRKSPKNR